MSDSNNIKDKVRASDRRCSVRTVLEGRLIEALAGILPTNDCNDFGECSCCEQDMDEDATTCKNEDCERYIARALLVELNYPGVTQ